MSDISKYIKKSDIKCPICQTLLDVSIMSDKVFGCPKCRNMGNIDLWQKLDRTRKALDVAVDALKEISLRYQNEMDALEGVWSITATDMCDYADTALEQITVLEQKD